MQNDKHNIQELIASYALGSLDADEVAQFEALLAESPSARQELAQYQQVTDLLGMAPAEIEPSASFEDRLFARISDAPAAAAPQAARSAPAAPPVREPQRESFLTRLSNLFAMPVLQAAGGLALVLLMFTSGFFIMQNNQLRAELDQDGLPTFQLASPRGIEASIGLVVMSLDGNDGAVIIDGMAQPPENSQYQLWLLKDNEVEAGPIFDLNERGYGNRWVKSKKPLNQYDHFMVTLEPVGGSETPTGDPVLEWMGADDANR